VRHDWSICATWLIHVWYDSFTCDMTHLHASHDSYMSGEWLICVWHASSVCKTWLIRVRHASFTRETWLTQMWHGYVPWLIRMCAMTHSCVCHDSFICVPWHTCECVVAHTWHTCEWVSFTLTSLIHTAHSPYSKKLVVRHMSHGFITTLWDMDLINKECDMWVTCHTVYLSQWWEACLIHMSHDSLKCSCVIRDRSPSYVTHEYIHRYELSHVTHEWIHMHKLSRVWHNLCICVTWLIHTYDMNPSYMFRDSFVCVTRLISHVRHDSFI